MKLIIENIFNQQPSEAQKIVIDNTSNAMVVVAGPGSGKTATLVNRIINMFANGAKPEEFFISTFTNKAADELKTRIDIACEKLFKKGYVQERINTDEMRLGTLHSLFYKLLTEYGPEEYPDYEIIDEKSHVHKVLNNNDIDFKKIPNLYPGPVKDVNGNILSNLWKYAASKNFVTIYDDIKSSDTLDKFRKWDKGEIIVRYNEFKKNNEYVDPAYISYAVSAVSDDLKSNNMLSFVDVENCLYHVIKNNQLRLNDPLKPFNIKHFIADEYQDTSRLQHKLILGLYDLVKTDDKSICVVGDDDQTLYRFRRAEVRNILNFADEVSGQCETVTLTDNFRSQEQIVDFYTKWMKRDTDFTSDYQWGKNRQEKELLAKRDFTDDNKFNPAVLRCTGNDIETWHNNIVKMVKQLKDSGVIDDYNQVAFLAGSVKAKDIVSIMDKFEAEGIKTYAPSASRFIKSKIVKQAICALYSCCLNATDVLLHQVKPAKDASDVYIDYSIFNDLLRSHKDLVQWINDCRANGREHAKKLSGLFYEMLQFEPFKSAVEFGRRTDSQILDAGNLKVFLDEILAFEKLKKLSDIRKNAYFYFNNFFNEFLLQSIREGIDEYEIEDIASPSGHMLFSTIHASKGLQFPVTIVGSLDSEPWPQYRMILRKVNMLINDCSLEELNSTDYAQVAEDDINEFKRKYYTAFSRAQDLLILTAPKDGCSQYFAKSFDQLPDFNQVNFSGKKASSLKIADGIKAYSFTTDIGVYEQCPVRYKYMRLLGMNTATPINMLFGTLVHESVEQVHKRYLLFNEIANDEQIKKIVEERFAILKNSHESNIPFRVERAVTVVKNYVENNTELIKKIKQVEYKVSNVEDDFILQGNIDLVTSADGESVELLDFKTGKVPDGNSPLMTKYYHQLLTYAHLITKKNGLKVSGLKLMFPGVVETDKDSDAAKSAIVDLSLGKTVEEISLCADNYISHCNEVIKKIESDDFDYRTTSPDDCKYCPLIYFCKSCGHTIQ